jgi:hypothetical protein
MVVSGHPHAPAALPFAIKPSIPTEYDVGGPQSRSEPFEKEQTLLPLSGSEPRITQHKA